MRRLKKREAKLLASVIASLIVLIVSWMQPGQITHTVAPPPPPGYYRVIKTEDGDTITIDMQGKEERVRFIGIDTPETQDPRKPVQCFGRAASAYTKQLIGNQPVRLESDPLSSNRDRYNRLLRYVYLPDGRLLQAEILTHGYGFAYVSFPFTRSDEFLAYQTQAREQNQGLWASCEPQPNQYGGFDANPEPIDAN
jgi:endonuclease YncB( thermonuclease family)